MGTGKGKVRNKNFRSDNLVFVVVSHLLGIDNLKPLLHLATLIAPALLISHQRDVGMFWDAFLTVTAVHTAAILLITQVVIAAEHRGRERECYCTVHTHTHTQDAEVGVKRSAKSVSPLSEFQIGCVVNHSWGFPIQSLPLQTKTAQKKRQ